MLLIAAIVYRKMENKPPIKVTKKVVFAIFIGILSILALGIGMCLTMIYNHFVLGVIIGIVGIILLLCLPLCKGLK